MAKDYYETLGVGRDAEADDIKRAYRKLARELHPDLNPNNDAAAEQFKAVNEAYEVLKDPQKRAAYDRYGSAAFDGSGPGGPGFDGNFASGFADIFDEMFGDFMGGRRGRGNSGRGGDLRYNMEISLEQAFNGHQAEIRVPSTAPCEACNGSGAEAGSAPTTCGTCHGSGRLRMQQGFFAIERTCPTCRGVGQTIDKPCPSCRGAGRVQKDKNLSVTIPAGVEDGTRIRLAGEGEAGVRGAQPGDLYIFLSIARHPLFERDGAHIRCRVPLTMVTAALGGAMEVPTIEGGRVKLTIPAGTQSGHVFRIRNKGMSLLRSTARGDMFVETQVETPVNLSKRQKELLREFDEASEGGEPHSHSPESAGFFAKVKDLWNDLTEGGEKDGR